MADTRIPEQHRIPPGPTEPCHSAEDLLHWMNENYARYGDIYRASIFGSDVYVVSNPAYCERILRLNWLNYPRAGQVVKRISLLLGNGLIGSNGRFWAQQRRMIQPAFSKGSIGELTDLIARENARLLETWQAAARRQESVNVTRDLSSLVLKVTLTIIFGEDYGTVAPHFDILAESSSRNLGFAQSFRSVEAVVRRVIMQRQHDRKTADDLLGKLAHARDRETGNSMKDSQLVKEIMTLVVAGHETTASLLNWMWFLLSKHQEAQDKLSEEFSSLPWNGAPPAASLPRYEFTRRVIDEVLRLYPPLWLMTRRAENDDYLGPFFVPAGTEIYISPYLIQHSPGLWDEPDHFDPDRPGLQGGQNLHELAMCPFGAGPRNCIGEFLARVEIQIHLMIVARELRILSCVDKLGVSTTGMNLLSKDDLLLAPRIRIEMAQ